MNASLRSTPHVSRDGAVMLPGRGIQYIWIARVHHHVGHASPLTPTEGLLPRLAAISGNE